MICYKAGRYIADLKGWSLLLDVSSYENQGEDSVRNLQLLNFNIQYTMVVHSRACIRNIESNNSYTRLYGEPFTDAKNREVRDLAIHEIASADNVIISDFWMGMVLRDEVDSYARESGVLEELRIDRDACFDDENWLYAKLIDDAESSVMVHIRRGDFKTHDGGIVVNSLFYNRAIKEMESKLTNPVFFVFSDDMEWCRDNIKSNADVHFVDCNDDRHAYRDMSLASSCDHFILSNRSTFSHQILELADRGEESIVIRSKSTDLER